MLRAGGEGVVADQQQRAGPRPGGGDGAGGGVQPGAAEMHIRLEIGALGPFVPGVHADQPLAHERVGGGALDQRGEPGLVARPGWRRAARRPSPWRRGSLSQPGTAVLISGKAGGGSASEAATTSS